MLTRQENERLTRVGPGTPAGTLFRRYWLPFALSEELPEPDGAPLRVRLLGEDLIAFRDSDGHVGLVDAYCPHRRAPMFFGRNEACGLRCVYHGWKFDRHGACVDMPSEPADSLFKTKVTIAAYPTWEGGRMIWAYLGPPALRPEPPDYEFLRAPETHRFVAKTFEECNYLQAVEGGLDTAHISFLHNISLKNKARRPRTADSAPRLEIETTPYGFRYAGIRQFDNRQYVRTNHFLMPSQQSRGHVIDSNGEPAPIGTVHGHIWVPIDDTHTFAYSWMYAFEPSVPLTATFIEHYETYAGRGAAVGSGYRPMRNKSNDYLVDRALQRSDSFTGISGINTQDFAIQEGMGPICDRSREHLGTTDRAVIAARHLLLEAIASAERGEAVRGAEPATHRSVRAVDGYIPSDARWQEELRLAMIAKF